jgi:hypothetical protein
VLSHFTCTITLPRRRPEIHRSIRIQFFDQPHINPSIIVKPGDSPGNQSVSDFVSMKPGTYPMSIAVVATPTQAGQTQNIRDQVSVIVK